MLNQKQLTSLSKFISLVLRHKPETIGLTLDEKGWADTTTLIDKMNSKGLKISMELLEHVVATNSKKRFSFNEDKTKIRASQGHSIDINLQLSPVQPPAVLYHGTGERSIASILQNGMQKRNRQHVHLSADIETAIHVGKRHGKPVVLIVEAAKMHTEDFEFYLSANGVWLTDNVPSKYFRMI
jgi:putative RNA 2'-phosphotransferase